MCCFKEEDYRYRVALHFDTDFLVHADGGTAPRTSQSGSGRMT